jgi:hypothetical protein
MTKPNRFFTILAGFLTLLAISLPFTRFAHAETFLSPHYKIEYGNFNITSGKKTNSTMILTDTVGQNAPGAFTNTGFSLKSGFQYIYTTFNQFTFKIENGKLNINLGTLVPGVGATDTNVISITSPSGHGYQIYSQESHLFRNFTGQTIPNTSCDVGSTCTESSSGTWTSGTTYGFGFNALGINSSNTVNGVGTSDIFPNDTYYRQFANVGAPDFKNPQIIMTESFPVKNHRARITYKANIPGNQPSGNYETAITFTAVPFY